MSLWESLKKPFISSKELDNSTIQTSQDRVDIDLTTDDVHIPYPKKASYFWNEKTVKYENAQKESNRIKEYRRIAKVPEVSSGIDEIVSECITKGVKNTVKPELEFIDGSTSSDSIKKAYLEAWDKVLELVQFESKGRDLFEKWYTEGRLVSESIYEKDKISKGIQKVVILSPLNFFQYRDEEDDNKLKYKYLDDSFKFFSSKNDETYDDNQITFIKSGLQDETYTFNVGYLDYILKTVNNINTIEDSLVIYRFLRSVEKRIWNIPVTRLAKSKAESYITKVMNTIKYDKLFNKSTGEIKNTTSMESIVDDWVFPVKNGEKIEVDTIQGDTAFINELNDHDLFLKKLYIGMKIPVNRLDETSTLDFSGEDVIKQELKFGKHTDKLLSQFQEFLLDLLKKEMLSTNQATIDEWIDIRKEITIDWKKDNQTLKKVQSNILVDKATAMNEIENTGVIGKSISYTTVLKTIWDMSDDDIEAEIKLIEEEKKRFKFLDKNENENEDEVM